MADIEFLENKAQSIRRAIIETAYRCGRSTHIGPALSCTDLMTAIYYGFMHTDPAQPDMADRDRMILSKGHACPVLYSILADLGFFPAKELSNLRHIGALLQGHPSYPKIPGVDMTTGSLGNGLGIGLGMAYFLKQQKIDRHVFVVLGDGEMNEGTVWEAVNAAPALRADNLIAVVDQNYLQSCGAAEDIIPMLNMAERWRVFGWNVLEVNGHDMRDIVSKLETAVHHRGGPVCIVAHTVKGKGVSFMEHNNAWHQKPLSDADYRRAMEELEG